MSISPGARLGPYEVLIPLGAGGMGEVYRARDTKLGRDVALKILPDAFASDPERLARFEREAKTLASLNHPYIAQIHGFQESGATRALVMELVEGEDLARRLARGPLPIDEALTIATQIADALEAAHEQGIVHRDLKPANIKLRPDGTVKVLDFGLAKPAAPVAGDVTNSPTLTGLRQGYGEAGVGTEVGVILGTAAYMAPEQARGKAVDKRADIWAFGCVLYEMLTGWSAFAGETVTDILAAVVEREPDLTRVPPATPVRVRELLRRCLQKDPKQRLRDIGEARIAINSPDSEGTVAAPRSGRRRRRELAGWIAAAALGLVAVGLATLLAASWRKAFPEPMRFNVLPPPGHSFSVWDSLLAVSPDGRRIAFVAEAAGASHIWVRPLDAITAQPIPGTDGAHQLFWSPDGRSLGFTVGNTLKRVDLDGGVPQALVSGIPNTSLGTWSSAGTILFTGMDGALWRIPASGGEPARVTTLDGARGETAHNFPAFLPDGRFLYAAAAASPEHGGIYLGAFDGRERRKLLPLHSSVAYGAGHLLYRREQTLVAHPFDLPTGEFRGDPVSLADAIELSASFTARGAFAVSTNGVLVYREASIEDGELAWFDRAGRHLGTIGPVTDALPRVSPDGTQLAVMRDGSRDRRADGRIARGASTPMDVWVVDLRRSLSSRFTFDDEANETGASWSPDSASIIYAAYRPGGVFTLMRKAAGGATADEKVFELKTMMFPRDVSPDGRYVLIAIPGSEKHPLGGDLAVVRLDGDGTVTRVTDTPFAEWWGRFSPDGRWVAYNSNESGTSEVYVQPFPGDGRKWRISHSGGNHPVWRGDSRELFYLSQNTMMAVDITAAAGTLSPSTPRKLFDTQFRPLGWSYDVSRDGKRFVIPVTKPGVSAPLTVVVNWPSVVARKQ